MRVAGGVPEDHRRVVAPGALLQAGGVNHGLLQSHAVHGVGQGEVGPLGRGGGDMVRLSRHDQSQAPEHGCLEGSRCHVKLLTDFGLGRHRQTQHYAGGLHCVDLLVQHLARRAVALALRRVDGLAEVLVAALPPAQVLPKSQPAEEDGVFTRPGHSVQNPGDTAVLLHKKPVLSLHLANLSLALGFITEDLVRAFVREDEEGEVGDDLGRDAGPRRLPEVPGRDVADGKDVQWLGLGARRVHQLVLGVEARPVVEVCEGSVDGEAGHGDEQDNGAAGHDTPGEGAAHCVVEAVGGNALGEFGVILLDGFCS